VVYGRVVPFQLTPPKHPRVPPEALGVVGERLPYAWGVLSEANAERRIPKAFGTSGSAAPARSASEK
jgi:hypothetical protein